MTWGPGPGDVAQATLPVPPRRPGPMSEDDDQIIDLSQYLETRSGPRVFSVAGGEGERSRLALPVWRAIYLLEGERGGIVWAAGRDASPRTAFVLDLAESPARLAFEGEGIARLRGREAPAMDVADGAITVLLSRDQDRSWFLVVGGPTVGADQPSQRGREDLLFLAGECAGLLRHRDLGETGGGNNDGPF